MKVRLEHKMYTQRVKESAFAELYKLVLDKGFRSENCLVGAIHSYEEGQSFDDLASSVFDLLIDAGFEVVYTSEALSSEEISIRCRSDKRASCHVQVLIKAEYHQIKPFIREWNRRSKSYGKERLFHVRPIEKSLESSLWYMFKEHFDDNGYVTNPYGEFLPFYDPIFSTGIKPPSIEDFHKKMERQDVKQLELTFEETQEKSSKNSLSIKAQCIFVSLFAPWYLTQLLAYTVVLILFGSQNKESDLVICNHVLVCIPTKEFGVNLPNAPPTAFSILF